MKLFATPARVVEGWLQATQIRANSPAVDRKTQVDLALWSLEMWMEGFDRASLHRLTWGCCISILLAPFARAVIGGRHLM